MSGSDEAVRIAVVTDGDHLPACQQRLLDALSQSTLAGFRIDLPGLGIPVGPGTDLIHVLGGPAHPGTRAAAGLPTPAQDPPGSSSAALAREHWIGLVASYPTAPYTLAPADCRLILSPSAAADAELVAHGARADQLRRWQPGVDPESFGPGHYRSDLLPSGGDQIHVLTVGIPEAPELLEQAFAAAHALEPRLGLVMVDEDADLPGLYASADLLAYLSTSAEFPLEIVEAQASGLPVLALDGGAAPELIEDGRNGVLVPSAAEPLAEALVSLARRGTLRERLTVGGLGAVRGRTWQRSMDELTSAWSAALVPVGSHMRAAA
jgi:hypothetical protein